MSDSLRNHDIVGTWSEAPLGVRFSSIILVLFALVLMVCALFCLIAGGTVLVHHGRSSTGLYLGVAGCAGIAASFVCFRAASALRNALRWGANVATGCGGLAVVFGSMLAFDFLRASKPSADEYFLYPLVPVFLLVGIWLCIYLNLPRVRSRFNSR